MSWPTSGNTPESVTSRLTAVDLVNSQSGRCRCEWAGRTVRLPQRHKGGGAKPQREHCLTETKKAMSRRSTSCEDDSAIIGLYRGGKKLPEIARITGCHPRTVQRLVARFKDAADRNVSKQLEINFLSIHVHLGLDCLGVAYS